MSKNLPFKKSKSKMKYAEGKDNSPLVFFFGIGVYILCVFIEIVGGYIDTCI